MEINQFTQDHSEHIAMQETMTLLTMDGSRVYYGEYETIADKVQDISFVVQNQQFDFINGTSILLVTHNEKVAVQTERILFIVDGTLVA